MKPSDEIYLRSPRFNGGREFRCHLVKDRQTDPPTLLIRMRSGDTWIVAVDEVELRTVSDARDEAKRKAARQASLQPIIDAWNSGLRTNKEIAAKLGVTTSHVVSKLACAKRQMGGGNAKAERGVEQH